MLCPQHLLKEGYKKEGLIITTQQTGDEFNTDSLPLNHVALQVNGEEC